MASQVDRFKNYPNIWHLISVSLIYIEITHGHVLHRLMNVVKLFEPMLILSTENRSPLLLVTSDVLDCKICAEDLMICRKVI